MPVNSETIKQLWALLGVTATAVLGWIGYALKVRTDMKKEEIDRGRRASESEREWNGKNSERSLRIN